MSSCCTPENRSLVSPESATSKVIEPMQHCPQCGTKGTKVDAETVKAMLAISLEAVRSSDYRFCHTAPCDLVYFATDGTHGFTAQELRERVYQKTPQADDVFVCYCFRHTPGSIRAEIVETGSSTVTERIVEAIQADQCACETRNPQGSCCLGNVRAVVKRITEEECRLAAAAESLGWLGQHRG